MEKESLAKNMIWSSMGNLVYCICLWAITILTVRLCSYDQAGYLSLAMSASSTCATIGLFSMRNYQISDINNEFSVSEYVGSRFFTCLLSVIFCFVYCLQSNSLYQALCIIAFMTIRIAECGIDVIHGVDQKHGRYDIIGKSLLIRGLMTVIIFSFCLITMKDLLLSLAITGSANIVAMVLYDIKQTSRLEAIRPSFNVQKILVLLKKCTPLVIMSFLLSTIPLLPKSSMQKMISNEMLGIYSSIGSPTLVVQVFATYAFNPLLPKLAEYYSRKEYQEFLRVFHKLFIILIGFSIFVIVGALIFGRLGLSILYGAEIIEHFNLFIPLVWCTILTAFVWILNSIVISIRRIYPMLAFMVISFGLDVMLNRSFIVHFGTNGASYIQMLCYIVFALGMVLIIEMTVRKESGE